MTVKIGVVVESEPDFHTGTMLADRVICECIDWLEPNILDHWRLYCGLTDTAKYVKWTDSALKTGAFGKNRFGPQAGHFRAPSGESVPSAEDALAARRVLIQMALIGVDAIVLLRDADQSRDRLNGLRQARTESESSRRTWTVIIGVAVTKRECWVLAGFEPRNEIETERLDFERRRLGFDPRENAHRLTAMHDAGNDKLSAKRVLSALVDNNRHREAECWTQTSLESLRRRGTNCGLTEFLLEVEQRLVPTIKN